MYWYWYWYLKVGYWYWYWYWYLFVEYLIQDCILVDELVGGDMMEHTIRISSTVLDKNSTDM